MIVTMITMPSNNPGSHRNPAAKSFGSTALIVSLYDARLRTRILTISQGTFTICHLGGPVVGGIFAAIHWWRGSFWLMAPFMLSFAVLAWLKIPERLDTEAERSTVPPFPFFRLGMLAVGASREFIAQAVARAIGGGIGHAEQKMPDRPAKAVLAGHRIA